ncbi:hypothetical protein PFICI_00062 [Pestalotiopsis fici W106-1]|uniref:VWFA domain-containing protein n=1 Tax=Pestalotiopsis fici (strain W106-1 / CGMCC3.15140) TaxID=1229662 RepID=W3XJP9_PESFW|nr:uncharacterized protein PFICI_00062 [Pestalotiopsis fici W106-1]ETS86234.1 hypothetical protein PFICI_00062 [Pestalotiopsis fici W106-1]
MGCFGSKQRQQKPGLFDQTAQEHAMDLDSPTQPSRPVMQATSRPARQTNSAAAAIHQQLHRGASPISTTQAGTDMTQPASIRRKPVAGRGQEGVRGADTEEDPFEFLKYFDTVFLIDDSKAMAPYWEEVTDLIRAIVPLCMERDTDGIDIYFGNHSRRWHANVHERGYRHIGLLTGHPGMHDNVEGIFNDVKPKGKHDVTDRLLDLLNKHTYDLMGLEGQPKPKPMNIIVVTAQPFSNRIARVHETAEELDKMKAPAYQVGIQFFQIGDDETASWQMASLDDLVHQKYGTRDIMDTATWTDGPGKLSAEGVLKVVGGAVERSLDNTKLEQLRMPEMPPDQW